jgi:2-oxoglutarate dehydrogenase E1 component
MSRSLRELYESSPFSSVQAPYVEDQYERFLDDPASVSPEWRNFFGQVGGARAAARPSPAKPVPQAIRPGGAAPAQAAGEAGAEKQSAVSRLIQFYANRGHLIADIDPLGLMQRPMPRVLDPAYVGLTEADLDREFVTGSRTRGVDAQMKLRDILKQLRHIYTGRIGAEFAQVSTSEERLWLQDRFQDGRLNHRFTSDERLNFLWQLCSYEGLVG